MSDPVIQPIQADVALEPDRAIQPIPHRNLWLAIAIQMTMLATVAAPAVYTLSTGKTLLLQTAPVDPYDLLRGYYQTLNYDLADKSKLAKLPGGKILAQANTTEFFVTLALPSGDARTAATPIAVSSAYPTSLASNQVAIRGVNGTPISYGIERFYLPEVRKDEVNSTVRDNPRKLLVEVKIDGGGHPVPVGLWVGDKIYRF